MALVARQILGGEMDVLANVLRLASLGNAVITQSELAGSWSLEVPPEIRVAIHLIRRGECWLRVSGALTAPMRLGEGDVVLIPNSLAHILSANPDTPPLPLAEGLALARRHADEAPASECANLLCAEITFDHAARHPLADVLPEVIHIPSSDADIGDGVRVLAGLLTEEAGGKRPGSEVVVAGLLDALLVLIVRHWLDTQQTPNSGWLSALKDKKIVRTLAAMHHRPDHPWTVAELADQAGMSRSTFARRFPQLVGLTPLEYLAQWRMNVAAKLLRTTAMSVESVALGVGYESATAFGNAFRGRFSIAPGRYRSRFAANRSLGQGRGA